jgi:glutamyl-Q tRNA(Asp) synthetase
MRLRIDDIDHTRCRHDFTQGIYDDLEFMGIAYDGAVLMQSKRMEVYQDALLKLKKRGLIYPCLLTRREVDELLSAPHGEAAAHGGAAPHIEEVRNTDEIITQDEGRRRQEKGTNPAWRLRMDAISPLARGLTFTEDGEGVQDVRLDAIGDVVVARKDIATSYHLSVVLDDAASGVTHVTRGQDLRPSTPLHRLIYHLLDLPPPCWSHHPLITDEDGRRLAKRHQSQSIASLRKDGMNRHNIFELLDS